MTILYFREDSQFPLTTTETEAFINSFRGTDLTLKRFGIQAYINVPAYDAMLIGSVYGDLAAIVADHNHRNQTDRMAAAI